MEALRPQSETNPENAQASTGPKTAEGKAAASRNATTHGLLATTLLSTEDPVAFEAFKSKLTAELAPSTVEETLLVEKIVFFHWRSQRADRVEADLFESSFAAAPSPSATPLGDAFQSHHKPFSLFLRYQRQIQRDLEKARAELRKLQTERKQATFEVALLRETKIASVRLLEGLGYRQSDGADPSVPPKWELTPQKVRDWAAYHARQKAERRTG